MIPGASDAGDLEKVGTPSPQFQTPPERLVCRIAFDEYEQRTLLKHGKK